MTAVCVVWYVWCIIIVAPGVINNTSIAQKLAGWGRLGGRKIERPSLIERKREEVGMCLLKKWEALRHEECICVYKICELCLSSYLSLSISHVGQFSHFSLRSFLIYISL